MKKKKKNENVVCWNFYPECKAIRSTISEHNCWGKSMPAVSYFKKYFLYSINFSFILEENRKKIIALVIMNSSHNTKVLDRKVKKTY